MSIMATFAMFTIGMTGCLGGLALGFWVAFKVLRISTLQPMHPAGFLLFLGVLVLAGAGLIAYIDRSVNVTP